MIAITTKEKLRKALENNRKLEIQLRALQEEVGQSERLRHMWQDSLGKLSKAHEELRQVQLDLKQRTNELEEANRVFALTQAAVDGASDGFVFLRSDDASFVYVSDSVCKVLGYTREEALGLKVYDILPDYSAEAVEKIVRAAQAEKMPSIEARVCRKNGAVFPVEIAVSHFEYEGAEYTIANIRNITKRKKAEEKLKQTMNELERFNRLAVGREKQIISLKQEINGLLAQHGQKSKHKSVE